MLQGLKVLHIGRALKWRETTVLCGGKGFGSSSVQARSVSSLLTESRAGTHRVVAGSYSDLLSKVCKVFEKMKTDVDCQIIDVYARLNGNDTCWFIGKVGYKKGVHVESAIASQEVLLCEYARSLRPSELGGVAAIGKQLQLWYAPGNSEMDVAQNKLSLIKYSKDSTKPSVCYTEIGYEPEIYVDQEPGFRVYRDSEGKCLKPPFEVDIRDMPPKM
eukprot:gene39474-48055_t